MTDRTFRCTGSVDIDGDTITCPYVHGTMDFYEAMANSCNCVFAQLAVELGGETMQMCGAHSLAEITPDMVRV